VPSWNCWPGRGHFYQIDPFHNPPGLWPDWLLSVPLSHLAAIFFLRAAVRSAMCAVCEFLFSHTRHMRFSLSQSPRHPPPSEAAHDERIQAKPCRLFRKTFTHSPSANKKKNKGCFVGVTHKKTKHKNKKKKNHNTYNTRFWLPIANRLPWLIFVT